MHLLIVRAERDRDRSWLACAVGSCSEQHVDGVEWSLLRGTCLHKRIVTYDLGLFGFCGSPFEGAYRWQEPVGIRFDARLEEVRAGDLLVSWNSEVFRVSGSLESIKGVDSEGLAAIEDEPIPVLLDQLPGVLTISGDRVRGFLEAPPSHAFPTVIAGEANGLRGLTVQIASGCVDSQHPAPG